MFDLSISEDVATIALNRPEKRNAIPVAAWPALIAACEEAVAADVGLVVLQGAGGNFSAGLDITDFSTLEGDPQAGVAFRLALRSAIDHLANLPIPKLAVIEGACIGAGVALAIACDLRVAAADAKLAIKPATFGLSYPQEDVFRLTSLVGPGQAAKILLTGMPMDSAEAWRIGLVEFAAEGDLSEFVAPIIDTVLRNNRRSLKVMKRGMDLARAGIAQDDEQDRLVDELLAVPKR